MKLTLVRHGKTEYNYQRRIQGRSNNLLNDEGRRQCKRLKEKIKDKDYDICFTSPLIRAVETAMILIGDRVEFITDERLIERDLGDLEGTSVDDYDIDKYWDYDLNTDDKGVEKIQDMFKRVENFLEFIKKEYPDKSILIVTHRGIIRAIHHILNKDNVKKLKDFKIDNCYLEEIEI